MMVMIGWDHVKVVIEWWWLDGDLMMIVMCNCINAIMLVWLYWCDDVMVIVNGEQVVANICDKMMMRGWRLCKGGG
jgi:hypothetical protein